MKTSRHLLCVWIASVPTVSTSTAATTWDFGASTNVWSTATNWDTNIEPLAADDVIFPLGLAATITLSAGELAKSLSFLDNYTFTGGALTLASANSITVGAGLSVTSSTAITAPGGLTKLGDGTMIFNTSNTFAGGVFVNAGILRATNMGALGAAGIVTTVNTGAILEIGAITLDRPMTLNSGATLRGVAATAVSNGIHTISNAASSAVTMTTLASTDVLTIGNGANDLTGGAADTLITVNGPGAVRLGLASNYAGLWQLDAGTLQLAVAGALGGNAGTTTLNGGALSARNNTATTFTGPVALNVIANSSLVSDRTSAGAGVTHTFGALSIAGQTLTVTPGANATSGTAGITVGNATITGNPTFAVVDVGSANGKLTTGSILGGGVVRTITKSGAGDLSITGGATDWIAGSQLNASGGGTVEALYPTLGAGASITPTVLQSPFGEAAVSFTDGGLRLAMDGENNSTAQTFVTGLAPSLAGTLTLEVDRRTIGSAKTVSLASLNLASGTVLSFSANNTYKTTIVGTTTLAGNATLQGTSGKTTTLTLGAIAESAASTLTFGGASSTHTVNLTAASGHTGGTNVKGGTINANVNGALGSGALLIENENVSSAAKLVVASGVTLSGPTSLTMNSGTLELQSLTGVSSIPLQINGGNLSLRSNTAESFTTNGSGIVLDGGAPTITVGNVASGFGLALNVGPLTFRNAPVITFANANSYSLTMGPLTLESDVTFNVNANVTVRTSLDPNNLVAGVSEVGGARKIIKSGTGTLELVGDSTITGGLDVNAGTVLIKHNSGAGSGAITVGNGVTTGTLLLTTGISLNNTITVNGGTLGRDNSGDGDSTFNGAITLAGDVELQSNTTIPFVLREAWFAGPITGAFDVTVGNGGIVKLHSASNTFGTGAADSIIVNSAMLAVSSDAAMGNAANGLTFSGSGPDFRPDSSFTTSRVFTFAHTGSAELQVNTGMDLTLTSSLQGTGAITKSGEGALILGPLSDGSSRGASLTTISDGTLRTQHVTGVSATGGIAMGADTRLEMMVDADTSFSHPMTRTITSGTAVLFVDRSPAGVTTNGRHTLPSITYASDLGDFTVQGDHGYGLTVTSLSSSGGSLVNNAPGELRIGSLVSTNTTTQTLDLGGSGTVVIQGATTQGTGSSSLRKVGAGTLTLGTNYGWLGALQCYESVLNLNDLNVTASSIGMGLGSAQSTSTINTGSGSITLTGNVTYDENGSGVTEQGQSTINGSLNLGTATRTFTLDDSSQAAIDMEINGIISGNPGAGMTKAGAGTLRLNGAGNTYDGLTTVTAGTLELNKSSGVAIGSGGLGILTSGSTAATVKLVQAAQFAASTPVIVGNSSGASSLELNNLTTTFNNLTLGGSQAALRVGATGTMVLGGNLVFENVGSIYERNMIITSTGAKFTPVTGGTLDLGGAVRTITVNNTTAPTDTNPTATIETAIINGGIIKTGTSGLVLAHTTNTFTGGLVIAQGTILGAAPGSFGTLPVSLTAGLGNTAVLGINISAATVTQDISTSGAGTNVLRYGGAIDTTATFSGAITLGSDLTFDVTNGEVDENDTALMIVSGVVNDGAGSFGIAKTGFGTTRLTQVNTFDGPVTVSSGRLAFSDIGALGTNATITMNGGVLEAEADVSTTKNLVFTNDSTLRASTTSVGFEITGSVTTNDNDLGFIGAGQIILSSGGGGTGAMMIGTYSNAFGTVTTNKLTGNSGVLSTRSGFTIPSGNILMDNYWVWELTSDMTRALGTGAGEIQMATGDGAGFAAFGADRTVNIGGAAATLTWGSGLFLVTGTNEGNLIFGCPSATHTVNWMNPLSMDNADTSPYLSFEVYDGPAAVEAVLHGAITFTGAGQGGLDFFGNGAMTLNGAVSGNLDLYANSTNTIRLTGGCAITGDLYVEGGTVEITTATSFGGSEYVYVNLGAELDIAATGVTLATTATGYMEVMGTLTGSANAIGEFYGTGTITGNLTTAATTLYYGDPTLPLTVNGNVNLAAGATLDWYLDDTSVPGTFVAIHAGGTVTLGSTLTFNVFAPLVVAPGDSFTMINKTSPGAVSGTFAGLAEGATFLATSGETFTISYIGGDGNDVVITAPVSKAVATIGTFTFTPGVGAELGQIVFDMTATGTLNASYDLQASIDLVNWTVVQTVTADPVTGALTFHIAQSPVTFTRRFFRIH